MNLQTGKVRISKKALCVILSIIMAFGTFITFTVGYSPLHEWLGIRNMLSAYAAEFVDTDGAVAVDEEAMLADDHTINLENKDGSNTVYLFSEPISYTDDNGYLKTKDISVEKAGFELKKEGYDFTNGQNDYRINFSKDYNKGIQAEFEGASYSIIPQSIIKVDGEEAVAEYLDENFEVYQYKNIYGNGTNLRFYPQLNGVKDEIILNHNINKNTFSFELKTENCTAQLNEDGTISLVNKEGTTIQTFAAPFAYDSEYVEGDNTNHYVDCEYILEDKNETSYIMTITVPNEWLNNANTKYPVTIDPTTSNISQAKDAGTYKKYKTQNWGTEQLCCFGYSHDYDKGRVYTQFTLPTAIKKGAAINSAYQWERECTGRTTSTKVIGYMVKASWSETGITWENKPGYNSNYASNKRTINSNSSDNNSPYWYKFSIKSIVNQWINGGSANYGITFRSDEEDNLNYNWRAFAAKNHSTSSYRPYTVINYTNDATAPTATGVSGNPTSWVKSATLKITGAKDNTGGIGLHSKPYSMSTAKGTYNWQASNSFTVTVSGKYYFYVRDAYGNTRIIKDPNDKEYFTVNKVDSTAPTFTVSGNPTNWVKSATLVADNATDNSNGIGLHSTAYSISNSASTPGTWKNNKNLSVNANGNYYIHVRDGLGNSRVSNKISVTKVDPTEPSYTKITLVDSTPKGNYIDVNVVGASDSQSGLHSTAYSFNGGTTWQSSPTYRCYTAQILNIRIRDAVGNIKNAGQKNVPDPTANAPVINSVSATYNADNNKTTITVDAEDVETDSEDLIYSFNGTVYGSTAVIDGKITDVDIVVTDEDNHSDTGSYTFTFAEKYDYDNLVGLYSVSNGSIQYRFDENDEWQDYSVPFEKPAEDTTIQINIDDCITLITLTPNSNEENSPYTESETDLTITNNDLSFDITRDYSSDSNEWRFSTETSASLIHDGKIVKVNMPDDSNLYFVKTAENAFTDEVTGYTLNETDDDYNISADGEAYSYSKSSGRLLLISDEFNHQIEFSYDSDNSLKSITASIGQGQDHHTYTIVEENRNLQSIKTPIRNGNPDSHEEKYEKLVYQYSGGKLIKVYYDKDTLLFKRSDDILLGEYSYENGRIKTANGNTINCVEGNYIVTTPAGEEIENEGEEEPTEPEQQGNELETVELDFSPEYPEYYNGTEIVHYDKSGYLLDTTAYITKNEYNMASQLIAVTETQTANYDTTNEEVVYTKVTAYTYYENSDTVHTETVTETENGNSTTTVTTYDTNSRVVSESTGGNTTSYTYDVWGNVLTQTNTKLENGVSVPVSGTAYVYDDLNRCVKETASENNEDTVTLYAYNPLGNIIYVRTGGEVTRTLYDKYGRVVQEIEPQDYSASDDGLSVNNDDVVIGTDSYANGNIGHRYVYDTDTRLLIKETNRLDVETTYTYYPNTSVVATESFDVYVLSYNTDGKITSSTVNGNTYATYSYNNDGNPTEVIYGNGQSIHYVYDSKNNLWKQYHNNSTDPYIVYDYVPAPENTPIDTGEQLELEENLEVTTNEDYVIKHKTNTDSNRYYTYYNSGEVKVAKADSQSDIIYSYNTVTDEDNHITTVSGVTGNKEYSFVSSENSITNTYDNKVLSAESTVNNTVTTTDVKVNNVTAYTVTETENSTSNVKSYGSSLTFTDNYNNANKSQISSSSDGTNTINYTYYDDGQLHTVSGNNYAASYSYNSRGNLTEKTVNNVTTNYSYTNDRLMSVNNTPLTYDSIGNVLTYGNKSYTWSSGRNLASITEGTDSYSYSYNKYGYRTSKTVNGVTTDFDVAEDGTVVSQSDGTNTLFFEFDNAGAPLGFIYNGTQYLYITNNSADVMAIADSTGNILATYSYNEWGEVTVNASEDNQTLANLNPLRYRGYYYDSETDYYYLQSRYYDPEICRFINADLPEYISTQKDEKAGVNIFVYCCNDAVNRFDPTGYKFKFSITKILDAFKQLFSTIGNACKALIKEYGVSTKKYKKITKYKDPSDIQKFVYEHKKDIKSYGNKFSKIATFLSILVVLGELKNEVGKSESIAGKIAAVVFWGILRLVTFISSKIIEIILDAVLKVNAVIKYVINTLVDWILDIISNSKAVEKLEDKFISVIEYKSLSFSNYFKFFFVAVRKKVFKK